MRIIAQTMFKSLLTSRYGMFMDLFVVPFD